MKIKKELIKYSVNTEKNDSEKKDRLKSIKAYNLDEYPDSIRVMIKRATRLEPWNDIFKWNKYDASLILYYKLKQKGVDGLKLLTTAKHVWVEFIFLSEKYIFDIQAIFQMDRYGLPIKKKKDANNIYRQVTRVFDEVDEFIHFYDKELTLTHDEAKIEASEDVALGSIILIKNFLDD